MKWLTGAGTERCPPSRWFRTVAPPTRAAIPPCCRALASPATYRGHPQVAVHETHASWVFVAGDRAYKVKKPVALGFLDYSTLARRRSACREEVRVNRELAPGIYLGVRAIVEERDGLSPRPRGRSRRGGVRGGDAQLPRAGHVRGLIAAGSLTRAHVAAAARLLADFHRSAAVVGDWGPERVLASGGGTWMRCCELSTIRPRGGWTSRPRFGEAFVSAHALGAAAARAAGAGPRRSRRPALRARAGQAQLRVVDRIEFDPGLRRTDVACDLAFLAMDLEAHGQRWAARELFAAYRHAGHEPRRRGAALLLRGPLGTRAREGGADRRGRARGR